jgi:hypothetical protein
MQVTEAASDRDPVAKRVAENEARFREANEEINALAERADLPRIPFVCECADLGCTADDEEENRRCRGRFRRIDRPTSPIF